MASNPSTKVIAHSILLDFFFWTWFKFPKIWKLTWKEEAKRLRKSPFILFFSKQNENFQLNTAFCARYPQLHAGAVGTITSFLCYSKGATFYFDVNLSDPLQNLSLSVHQKRYNAIITTDWNAMGHWWAYKKTSIHGRITGIADGTKSFALRLNGLDGAFSQVLELGLFKFY